MHQNSLRSQPPPRHATLLFPTSPYVQKNLKNSVINGNSAALTGGTNTQTHTPLTNCQPLTTNHHLHLQLRPTFATRKSNLVSLPPLPPLPPTQSVNNPVRHQPPPPPPVTCARHRRHRRHRRHQAPPPLPPPPTSTRERHGRHHRHQLNGNAAEDSTRPRKSPKSPPAQARPKNGPASPQSTPHGTSHAAASGTS
jgi:hypothetical protein